MMNARRKRDKNKRFKSRAGQTMVEYVLVLAVAFMIFLKVKQVLVTKVEGAVNTFGSNLDKAVQQSTSD